MRRSKTLEKLRRDETVLVINSSLTASAKMVEIAGIAGFDCLWIDTEHRDFFTNDLYGMLLAARLHDVDAMVRIRKQDYGDFFRPLEMGATGIMVPHVMSADEARWVVRNAKFAPEGLRGMDAAGPDARFTDVDPVEYAREANRETFVCLQIEDREAVECIDEIASVPGVGILFVGPGDLSQSYGVPFQYGHECVLKAVERVAEAAARNGISWGIPGTAPETFERYCRMGARFIPVGSDTRSLVTERQERHTQFRGLAERVAGES